MPPGGGDLKPEHEIILAVVLPIVGLAILSFAAYKIRTHTRALKIAERQQQQDLERNGLHQGAGGRDGGGGARGLGGSLDDNHSVEKKQWTAGNLAPKLSVATTAVESRSRRSAGSGSDSGADLEGSRGGQTTRLYIGHKAELPGDEKAPDEIDGKGLSAAKDKYELEGSGPPVELPVEPIRLSRAGTGTMGMHNNSMTRTPSDVSDATTLFRYNRRPSYVLRTPIENVAEGEAGLTRVSPERNTRLTEMTYGVPSSGLRHHDDEVSPLSPGPRSTRAFSLDGTVVEAQLGEYEDGSRKVATISTAPAPVEIRDGQPVSRLEPAVLRKDKWKVWRALAEETRGRH